MQTPTTQAVLLPAPSETDALAESKAIAGAVLLAALACAIRWELGA